MSTRNPAARRLQRLLKDPKYGPKLRHLPRGEQRRISDLVASNQGRQARRELLAADEARRAARNLADRTRRRTRAEQGALDNLRRMLPEARTSRVQRNIEQMSFRDLKFAREAGRSELRDRATNGKRIVVGTKEINLFWYH